MTAIANPIEKQLEKPAADEIAKEFFGSAFDLTEGFEAFVQYFDYYNGEVASLNFGPRHDNQTTKLSIVSHDEIPRVVKVLRRAGPMTRPALREELECGIFPGADSESLNRSIDVALRLWLMVNTRESKFRASSLLQRPNVQWNDESTLKDFLHSLFPHRRWELVPREGRHDPLFTAAFMTRICGLGLNWTTSLEDHLRLDRKTMTLWVFPYKNYVRSILEDDNSLGPDALTSLLPRKMLKETIDSLLLLFPEWDKQTQALLAEHNQDFCDEEPYEPARPLGIRDFDHWQDRLLELYQEVYQGQTPKLHQLMRDRRNPQQHLTFWLGLIIALLTFISTVASIVSMVTGIIQVTAPSGNPPNCFCNVTGFI